MTIHYSRKEGKLTKETGSLVRDLTRAGARLVWLANSTIAVQYLGVASSGMVLMFVECGIRTMHQAVVSAAVAVAGDRPVQRMATHLSDKLVE